MSRRCYGVGNHCNFTFVFRPTTKETSSSSLLALCNGNPWVIGEFPSERASDPEVVPMPWCYRGRVNLSLFLQSNATVCDLLVSAMTTTREIPGEATLKNMAALITRNHHMNSLENDDAILYIVYSISQEICTRFLLCCALLWLYIDWFSHIHQAYFTGTVAI